MSPAVTEIRGPFLAYRRFARRAESVLHCEDLPLAALAERFGTPLYVYSATMISDRLRAFDRAFREIPHTVCYSVKANSNLSILRLLANLGCGFDVVSGGELERVLHVNRALARKVVFSGVGKTPEEMRAALRAGILLFNVESQSELEVLAECAARSRKTAQIALRVNPDVSAATHPYIATGLHRHKFGIPIGDAIRLYSRAAKSSHLKVAGVSVHIGSQIMDVRSFGAATRRIADLVSKLRKEGHAIKYVDAGGGLGIRYDREGPKSSPQQVKAYAQAVTRPLRNLKLHLLLEPGRSIVGPAGVLLIRVLYRKKNNRKQFLVVDAAMNDLIRPSLYNAFHEIVPVRRPVNAASETVDVVGPICESGDFLARDRKLPVSHEGDLLAVLDTGAYGMALASNYNTRPHPGEVLVGGKSAKIIRRRESIPDLFRLEML